MSSQNFFYGHPNQPLWRSYAPQVHSASCQDLPSVDDDWDRSGRPLDVARSRVTGSYGQPLSTATDDWSRAAEAEAYPAFRKPTVTATSLRIHPALHGNSRPLPQAANPQGWTDAINAANAARREQQLLEAAVHTPLPLRSVSDLSSVVAERQPTGIETLRSSSVNTLRQPTPVAEPQKISTTVEAIVQQTPVVPDRPHTVIKDQNLVTSKVLEINTVSHQDYADLIAQDRAISERSSAPKRASIGRSIKRTGSQFLAVLRKAADKVPTNKANGADRIMAEWQALLSEREEQEMMMQGAYDPFQDMIEEAFDLKYKELRGEGSFLIQEESVELPVNTPIELSVEQEEQEELAAQSQAESIWLTHSEKEKDIAEFRDPHTGSVRRPASTSESPGVSRDYMVCSPPRPPHTAVLESGLTYDPEPRSIALAPPEELQHHWTPSPTGDSQSVKTETGISDKCPETPSPSRLPRRVTRDSGSIASGHTTSQVLSSPAQPDELLGPQTPPKYRKDSVQPGASQCSQPGEHHSKHQTTPSAESVGPE